MWNWYCSIRNVAELPGLTVSKRKITRLRRISVIPCLNRSRNPVPFELEKVDGDGGETDISETVVRDAAFTVDVTRSGIAVTSGSEVGMTVCMMAGSPVMRTRLGAGTHTINTVPLAPGIYIVRVTDGNTVRSVKFVR